MSFQFPSEITKVKYENLKKKAGEKDNWELHIVPKRINSDTIAPHNIHQLKHWRANVDFSIVHDYRKVTQYVAKYASKAEVKSNAYKSAFEEIFNDSDKSLESRCGLKKVITKVLGMRDISMHEALHLCMSLDLHSSNITVVKTSLLKSNLIKKKKRSKYLKNIKLLLLRFLRFLMT